MYRHRTDKQYIDYCGTVAMLSVSWAVYCEPYRIVCECQQQFARREEGEQLQLPCFAGRQGLEVTQSLLNIEATFEKNLKALGSVKDILNVRNTAWHDGYSRFRAEVKDLEMMMQNLIRSAFETVNNVEEGVQLLDVFQHLSAREAIRRTIDRKMMDVYTLFSTKLSVVNEVLCRISSLTPAQMPQCAGQAHWARALRTQIERPMEMFNEIHYWDRLLFEIPHFVTDVYQRKEELHNLKENVLLVVKDYNRIITALNAVEMGLFSEKLRFLNKKIQPGLSKLHWSTKGTSNVFINDCRVHANKVQLMVDEYKAANLAVSKLCAQISELLLVRVDGKTVYGDLEFQEDQQNHQHSQLLRLQAAHQDMVNVMARVYATFQTDGPEVQRHWMSYMEKMDRMVEDAFRVNIKCSLQELSKAINGDGKNSPDPLFSVEVVLKQYSPGSTAQVDFSPTLPKLAQIVNSIDSQLINTISGFKRLPDLLTHQNLQKKPMYKIIEQDEEICKIHAAITAGMVTNVSHLQTYLKTWDKHREIWEIEKDIFIQRYQRLNPAVSSFDSDIARYTEVANNVQKEETVLSLQCVLLDCSPLKFSLLQHCNEWQSKFTQLLSLMASAKLKELHIFLQENALRVSQPPQTLAELVESLKLLENLHANLSKIESQIPPIHEQFAILEKYEVTVDPAVLELLEALSGEWVWFQQVVIDSDIMLKKHKDTMKSGLILSSEEFKKKTQAALQSFSTNGPFTSGVTPDSALKQVSELRAQLEALMEEEGSIRRGLTIFKIEQAPSKDILALEKDKQWDAVDFTKSRIEQFKKIIPLIADLRNPAMRERHWDQIQQEVQQSFDPNSPDFTLEKIVSLGLDHHAERVSDISGAASKELSIEQTGHCPLPLLYNVTFSADVGTSEKISGDIKKLNADLWFTGAGGNHENVGGNVTGHYTLQRQGSPQTERCKRNAPIWRVMQTLCARAVIFISVSHPPVTERQRRRITGGWCLTDRGTEEVFQALEDNQVTLSVMKASRFVKAFEKEVDHWERCLSLVLEVIEMILTVQRQWMYLENIFQAEDIRKQLPHETAEFDDVNSSWKKIMERLNKDKNALKGTHHPGLLEKLTDMNSKLEEIQKSLDMYLETKRQIFPRFYFLSNDDLLEILGQSRNPEAVQPHLKKCFDNIKSLRISKAWLCDVERTMRCTLKDCLKNCCMALKRMAGKRGKWVRDWPGQMLITTSQIQWTTDVTRALVTNKETTDKSALKSLKKKQVSMLNQLSEAIRGNLSKILRLKIVALVTVEVHARDVISKLAKAGCCDVNTFDWLCQLRLYWDKDVDDCIIKQTNTHFRYGYEYLGNSGRLVITPLTDRCYMTLTTALHLHRGGSPKGPAGTGKTETVKDLGKALGMYVIVVNCSEGLDFKSMGRMYSGLAQTGAWGCFDEFNRINIEVLSVVAQQILSILSALSAGVNKFIFEGKQISLVWSCGIFITMNPGYAGRTELPDNLKSMFRPISMVVPDSTLIAEITLFAEGFSNCKLGSTDELAPSRTHTKTLRGADPAIGLPSTRSRHVDCALMHECACEAPDQLNGTTRNAKPFKHKLHKHKPMGITKSLKFPLAPSTVFSLRARSKREASFVDAVHRPGGLADVQAQGIGLRITNNGLEIKRAGKGTRTSPSQAQNVNGRFDCPLIVGPLPNTALHSQYSRIIVLAKKVFTLYSLAVQQLSKQDHYDFGLRALTSLLRYAGKKRRVCPDIADEEILLMSMKDMNIAKLTTIDLPLFNGIIQDLFPAVETPTIDYGKIKEAIEAELHQSGLQVTRFTMTKVIQLYETKNSRHSTMIVGKTGSGKTVTWRTLQNALSNLHHKGEPGFNLIRYLSVCTRSDEKPDEKWIVFDGPVDTLWIESMNSVMDDNKVLTLINGERISMPEQVSLLFEVEDLAVASPATVSRCGMVYNDYSDLSWKPYVQSWMEKRQKIEMEHLKQLFEQYMEKTLTFKKNHCKELVSITELNGVASLCRLYDSLATPENGVNPADPEHFSCMVKLWFIFSLIWSVCGSVDEDGRKKIDNFLREIEGTFPNKDTIYEYYVDTKNKKWASFEDKLPKGWRYASNAPFYKIMVPTVDTVRYHYLVKALVSAQHPVLLTGPVGTGKTSVAQSVLQSLDTVTWATLTINMSSQTSSNNVQEIIESRVEKRIKGVYVPVGGKNLLVFLDDLNMPSVDDFGSQPPLELLRLWIDYGFWYDRQKQTLKSIKESQIKLIYGTMISQKLQEFEEEVKPIGGVLTQATLELYQAISARFLPTPAKIHYLFNLRDISKVFQGLLRAHRDFHDTKQSITRLWIHECFRAYSHFARLLSTVPECDSNHPLVLYYFKAYRYTRRIMFDKPEVVLAAMPHACTWDFLRESHVYEDLLDFKALKAYMEIQLEDYNLTPGVVPMSLVLFRDAIEHVTRVVRVISQHRGNMLLVGIGGSGRQSLTRLAAFICQFTVFQVEVTKQYRKQDFRDDIKKLYRLTGVENKPTVFLFNDTQIVDESFLEDINNILSSGELPNLYKADEFDEIQNALSDSARKDNILETPDAMFNYLIERVRNNLHIVLCMSPVGDPFRNRIRQYPALVNCTTIDWFCEWPRDALLEVAERCLDGLSLGNEDGIQAKVASIFVTVHQSVAQFSHRMKVELKRHNYVTPTNYLELVSGYKKLLSEKRDEFGEQLSKLKNGLFKIDDTRIKVEAMSLELEDAKKKVAAFQKQCEEYLVVIVQQKRDADEQQKAVGAHSEKIEAEEIKCKAMAENAQRDLDEALPALQEAMKALESLNKKDMTEIKSYGRPPALVETVLQAVMILRGCEPTWAETKRQLGTRDISRSLLNYSITLMSHIDSGNDPGEGNFIKQLVNFDKDNISDRVLKTIGHYCTQPDFQPEIIGRVSLAAKSLCMWVRAMEVYGRIYRVVEPKRAKLHGAVTQLAEKQASLAEAQGKLREVGDKLDELKRQYDEKLSQKEELRRKSEDMELKLDRAGKLLSGLAGERVRWEETVAVRELEVPCSPGFSFAAFLSKPTAVREWNIQGLPSDAFSTENGVIVTRGNRWPLMVDPQGQAQKWIKNMELKRGLKVIDLQMPEFLRVLENAVQFGFPVLLQNVQEELDPALAPILNKSLTRVGGRFLLKLGDKEVEYSPEFRFYMTTKLSNPHYTPEISSKTTIVNFAVKEQGLEAQLLGIVVRKERPELEEQKDSLVINIASGRRKLQELEDEILRLLNEATGSLLDDVQLVNTLQTSKVTATEVAEQLEISELTESQIDIAREAYRPCAQRASILFFVLNDLGFIDPMYQFSLDAYITLFTLSIESSPRSHKLEERINNLNRHHTYAVYRSKTSTHTYTSVHHSELQYTCQGLFECHKLLFSFHMCAKILEASGKLNMDEYNFFLRGGLVLDKEEQMDNPCSNWLSDANWDNITELDKLTNFHGLMASFEQYPRDWHLWYTNPEPEKAPLPGNDRISICVTDFVIKNLGPLFVEPPILDMKAVVADSTTRTPLIFVLSPGVDPTAALVQLAETSGMGQRFFALSLGHWVFLANCHLSLSWMCELDKLVDELQIQESHPDFRLWLSSSPHPEFPIAILQTGIKITTEPPRGVKWNMKRLYQRVSEFQFSRSARPPLYRKLLFTLCFFHSIILERRKFLQLGWNIVYSFNDSDFEVSESLLSLYLDEYEEIPWDALKFLIAGINYGGHVTDDWDRRLLTTYINHYFCPAVIDTPFFKLSSLLSYYVPRDGPQTSYVEFIDQLPALEHPELFGQHPNADIASQITETRTLFRTLLSLQPQITSTDSTSTATSREDKVLELSADVLQKIPALIDYEGTRKLLKDDLSPLNVVLLQEIQRYNTLLHTIRSSLLELEKGIKGLVVMSSSLEEIFYCIHDARVPPLWEKAYPSLKPLASWTRDLCQRVEQFAHWAETAHPPFLFWLSGFTFPTGFLTAVLQISARQHNVSVDNLSWEFTVTTVDDNKLLLPPKDGVLIQGLYLEGAGWDKKASCLVEAEPMQLGCPMPTIHFKPVESRKRVAKNMYSCPCFYYPLRSGDAGRPSFVVAVDLKCGAMPYDHWVKRGTALLMSLDN
ncbi:Dynein heavy chain 2, axonemal [Triplophysa tibetana]|uniref:Dynein axonemal heavy chain 2 n=1 Tax=Triplophysa tibetana TaxID=1572043 RepID=A0A5A9PMM6_9TELE|nr:Dynein heavy chain 2, axonemal [Triplophysa tibetana]